MIWVEFEPATEQGETHIILFYLPCRYYNNMCIT
jgi:hypothetical protein